VLIEKFASFFRFSISFTVSSLLPTSLQSFHSLVEFLEMVYFSVLDSFTNKFLSFKTSGIIVSIFSSTVLLVDAQLISSAYCWSSVNIMFSVGSYP